MSDFDFTDTLRWTPAAKAKLKNIPFFARTQARKQIEQFARAANLEEITVEIVERARLDFGQ
ncbi:MAG: PCP reductase family protein [Prochloron sp. SP5CPC1]|nr:PCP reductase family protein [Candidatus Paraprochloron terpiosi SP5CPC1]